MSRRSALRVLTDGLHGKRSATRDWMALISAANGALVTPALREALAADDVPQDAAAFMDMIAVRNDERNQRLRTMMLDATAMLNTAGVTPIYLKGMAIWAACRPDADSYPRMMSDVDLLVAPDETRKALEALTAGGFKILARHGEHRHDAADLGRDGDVGVLDLHRRPPGPPELAALFDRGADTIAAPWPGEARIPSPTHQVYLICLHDMFHDGGFWRGGFDVRHLCDIAELTRHPDGVDWDVLMSLPPTRLMRNAMLSQLVAAHRIAAAPIPARLLRTVVPHLHHRIHEAQYLTPALGLPLALLGVGLEGLNLRQHWPYLGPAGTSPWELLWGLAQRRFYPNKI
jgi:hypothetical protein